MFSWHGPARGETVQQLAGQIPWGHHLVLVTDAEMRHPHDSPSIVLLLCREKQRLVVEYALRDVNKPIGVAE